MIAEPKIEWKESDWNGWSLSLHVDGHRGSIARISINWTSYPITHKFQVYVDAGTSGERFHEAKFRDLVAAKDWAVKMAMFELKLRQPTGVTG